MMDGDNKCFTMGNKRLFTENWINWLNKVRRRATDHFGRFVVHSNWGRTPSIQSSKYKLGPIKYTHDAQLLDTFLGCSGWHRSHLSSRDVLIIFYYNSRHTILIQLGHLQDTTSRETAAPGRQSLPPSVTRIRGHNYITYDPYVMSANGPKRAWAFLRRVVCVVFCVVRQ